MVKSVAFTIYPVADLERAKAFYRDVVGLSEPTTLTERWAEFDVGGSTFAVATGGEAIGVTAGSAFSIAFEVENLEDAINRLRSHGAQVDEPFEVPTCRACFARDPDGNRFGLHQIKQ